MRPAHLPCPDHQAAPDAPRCTCYLIAVPCPAHLVRPVTVYSDPDAPKPGPPELISAHADVSQNTGLDRSLRPRCRHGNLSRDGYICAGCASDCQMDDPDYVTEIGLDEAASYMRTEVWGKSWDDTLSILSQWLHRGQLRYVVHASVHERVVGELGLRLETIFSLQNAARSNLETYQTLMDDARKLAEDNARLRAEVKECRKDCLQHERVADDAITALRAQLAAVKERDWEALAGSLIHSCGVDAGVNKGNVAYWLRATFGGGK
jgi:hypothetical protein